MDKSVTPTMGKNLSPVKLSIERCQGTFKDPGYGNIILLKNIDPYTQKVTRHFMMKCFTDSDGNKDIYYCSLTKLFVATDMEMAYFLSQTDELDFFKIGVMVPQDADLESNTEYFGAIPLGCIYYDVGLGGTYIKVKQFNTNKGRYNSIRLTEGRFIFSGTINKVVPLFVL